MVTLIFFLIIIGIICLFGISIPLAILCWIIEIIFTIIERIFRLIENIFTDKK
jgi:hypothetical protein